MARQPKPTFIKKLEGNPGKRALNKNEPKFSDNISLTPPKFLSKEQKDEWKKVMRDCPLGLLKSIDEGCLISYVIAKALQKEAAEKLQTEEMVTMSGNGSLVQNPLINIINKQTEIIIKCGAQMGFSPTSRTKVSVEQSEEETNGFKDLLN